MKEPQIVIHKGKQVYYMDFSNVKLDNDVVSIIDKSKRYIHSQSSKSVLALTNIEGMHFNNEIKSKFSDFIKSNEPYIKASAVVGLSGLQRIVYSGITKLTGRNVKAFGSSEQAIDWLTSN